MADQKINIEVVGKDSASGVFQKISGSLGRIAEFAVGGLIVGGIQSIGGAIAGMTGDALTAVASNERLTASLQSLVKREMGASASAEDLAAKTADLVAWQEKLAIESPFSQQDVQQSFRMALAYGFTTDQAKRLTTAMIDFAAGSGATGESMQRISLALGQVRAKGKLSGEEMMQLTEAGLNVREMLIKSGKVAGLTAENFDKMQEKGLIPATLAIEAITSALENDFAGAAKAQSGTFAGLISSFEDLKTVALRDFAKPIFDQLQPVLNQIVSALQSPEIRTALQAIGTQVGAFVGQLINGFQIVVGWVGANWPAISAVIGSVIAAVTGFINNEAVPAASGLVSTLQDLVGWVVQNWPILLAAVQPVLEGIAGFIQRYTIPMLQFLAEQFGRVVAWVQENWPLIRATVEAVFNAVKSVVETVAPILFAILDGAFASIKATIETAVTAVMGIIKAVMQVITGDWSGAWETIKATVEGVIHGVIAFLGGLPTTMLNLGLDLINGLIEGIKKQGPEVIATIRRIIDGMLTDIKNFLGIRSPSRVMMEIGANMARGMMLGYASNLKPLAIPAIGGAASGMLQQPAYDASDGRFSTARPVEVVIQLDGATIARKVEPHLRVIAARQVRAYG